MSTNVPAGCSCPLAWSDFIIAQPLFLPLLSGLYPVASFTGPIYKKILPKAFSK